MQLFGITHLPGWMRRYVTLTRRSAWRIYKFGMRSAAGRLKTSPSTIVRRSHRYRNHGELVEAEKELLRGRAIYPREISLALEHAKIATTQNNQIEAARRWQAVIDEFGADAPPTAWLMLSRQLRTSEQFQAASQIIQQGLAVHPGEPLLSQELARIGRDGRWHPSTMNDWAMSDGPAQAISTNITRINSRQVRRTRSSFITSTKFNSNDRFVQACAFGGMQLCHSKARDAIRWADDCRRSWLEVEEMHELSWTRRDQDEKREFIGHLLSDVFQSSLEGVEHHRRLTLGLSSGFDSRTLLHALRGNTGSVEIFTFGQIGNCDFDFVTHLAKEQSLNVRLFDTSDLDWNIRLLDELIHHTHNYPLSPVMMATVLMNEIAPRRIELHGNFGDLADWRTPIVHPPAQLAGGPPGFLR